jgi:hypothetical protein
MFSIRLAERPIDVTLGAGTGAPDRRGVRPEMGSDLELVVAEPLENSEGLRRMRCIFQGKK